MTVKLEVMEALLDAARTGAKIKVGFTTRYGYCVRYGHVEGGKAGELRLDVANEPIPWDRIAEVTPTEEGAHA